MNNRVSGLSKSQPWHPCSIEDLCLRSDGGIGRIVCAPADRDPSLATGSNCPDPSLRLLNGFSMLELLIGLPNVRVLSVDRVDGVLEIHLETAEPTRFCPVCGVGGVVKDRKQSRYVDLPFGGQQAVLVWHTYRWSCPGGDGSWTEERPDIASRYSSAMSWRAAAWATVQVGRSVRPVKQIADELGVAWNTVMDTVTAAGRILIDDPARVGATAQLGVDETVFGSAGLGRRRSFVSLVTDVEARKVLDVSRAANGLIWLKG
jgi:zinc-finger of transposase IS204/IS1001/IS1096/IS1165/Helix-turn-helix domain of transposase family ISL3